jgi:hypothetical protein
MFFSFLATIQGLKLRFSFSTYFSVSSHIPGHTVFVSYFARFSVFSPYSKSYSVHFSFHVFQRLFFFWHISGFALSISHFPRFSVYLAMFQVIHSLCFIFLVFLNFLPIIQVLQCAYFIFHVFQYLWPYFRP